MATAVAGTLLAAILMAGCSNSDVARQKLKEESENGYGVMRTVTAYSQTGEEIGSWHGKIDVDYGSGSSSTGNGVENKVDLVFFDGDEPVDRIILTGPVIVIVDNDSGATKADGEVTGTTDATEPEAKADGEDKATAE